MQVLYTGHLGSEPMWGTCLDDGPSDTAGTAEAADQWARQAGFVLIDNTKEDPS